MLRSTIVVILFAVGLLTYFPVASARVAPLSVTTSDLNAVVLLSSNNGWAVGDSGTILHFDGMSWNLIASGTSTDLLGLSFGSPLGPSTGGGFAVGGSGGTATAMFWSGVGWTGASEGLSSPDAQRLASVFALSANDAWAVDSVSGGIWHWSGSAGLGGGWTLSTLAISGLNSIFMTSATEGWAVGAGGVIYHYTGGGWTLHTTVGTTLNAVFMTSPTDGWALGNGGAIYHYLAGSWVGPISPPATNLDLKSVFMLSGTEGWAVGAAGTTLHYASGLWNPLAPNQLSTNQNLNSVFFYGGVGWAVGDLGTIVTMGLPQSQGIPAASFRSVYLSSKSEGWIVGCSTGGCGTGVGEPVVAHWSGTSITRGTVSAAASDLYSVFMVSSADGWAVGGVSGVPQILHFSGGSWTQIPTPLGGYALRSVFMTDANSGWAVGDGGVILHHSGGSWSLQSSPTTNTLRSVFMLGTSGGWVVGDAGTILRYQSINGQWVKLASPTGANLNSVFLTDVNQGWAVGSGGAILHYDGTIWTNVADFVSNDLNSVFQVNPQEAWAVGNSATILRWTGIGWYPVPLSPALSGNPDLYSIFLVSADFGLVVGGQPGGGSQGTVLQIGQHAVTPIPEVSSPQALVVSSLMMSFAVFSVTRRLRRSKMSPHQIQAKLN